MEGLQYLISETPVIVLQWYAQPVRITSVLILNVALMLTASTPNSVMITNVGMAAMKTPTVPWIRSVLLATWTVISAQILNAARMLTALTPSSVKITNVRMAAMRIQIVA